MASRPLWFTVFGVIFLYQVIQSKCEEPSLSQYNDYPELKITTSSPLIRDTDYFECYVKGGDYYDFINFPEDYLVFPIANYTKPICVRRSQILAAIPQVELNQVQCRYCNRTSCSKGEEWPIVGKYSSNEAMIGTPDNYETQTFMCTTNHLIHLLFVTVEQMFQLSNETQTLRHMYVEIKVDPDGVIHQYSENSASMLNDLWSAIPKVHDEVRNGSRVAIPVGGAKVREIQFTVSVEKGLNFKEYNSTNKYQSNPSPILFQLSENDRYGTRRSIASASVPQQREKEVSTSTESPSIKEHASTTTNGAGENLDDEISENDVVTSLPWWALFPIIFGSLIAIAGFFFVIKHLYKRFHSHGEGYKRPRNQDDEENAAEDSLQSTSRPSLSNASCE